MTKISPQVYLCTRKKWLNFGSHPPLDLDPGIFWRILQHCKIGHFSTIWLISPERVIGLSGNFIADVSLDKEVPLNFGNNPEYGSSVRIWIDSGYRLYSPQLTYAVSDYSCFVLPRAWGCFCLLAYSAKGNYVSFFSHITNSVDVSHGNPQVPGC